MTLSSTSKHTLLSRVFVPFGKFFFVVYDAMLDIGGGGGGGGVVVCVLEPRICVTFCNLLWLFRTLSATQFQNGAL